MRSNPIISFMTTLGVNIGDEFIREGIASFFDEMFDRWTPLYVDKHNLLTLHERIEDEPCIVRDKFREADIIVQAGAPVYWKLGSSTSYNVAWAEALWEQRIFKLGPEKPLIEAPTKLIVPFSLS